MIVIGKSQNKKPSYLEHDKSGEKELKWTILTAWNNFQVLYKTAENIRISNTKTMSSIPQINIDEYPNEQQSVPSDEDHSFNLGEQPYRTKRKLDDEFNYLVKLFQPVKGMNPNLLHSNINRFNDKFNTYLKDTVEVQLLKFLPSQFFIALSSQDHTKLVYDYNFRDNLNNDHIDFSQNGDFLRLVHYYINNYDLRDKTVNKSKPRNNTHRGELKTTQSATKSRMMNNPVEDSKHLEDDEYNASGIIEDNSNSIEFCISGVLVRILQIENMPVTKTKETFYLIVVFQRYIRRRRTMKRARDPDPNDRCYTINKCRFPTVNITDRRIICSSLSKFVEISLVVDRDTFLRVGIEPSQRKKILKASDKAELEIEDAKNNALILSYAKFKDTSSHKLRKLGNKSTSTKPVKPGDPVEVSDIEINVDNKDESNSNSNYSDEGFQDYHYDSEYTNNFLDMSYTDGIKIKRKVGGNNLKDINKQEIINHDKFFDNDSSISVAEHAIPSSGRSPINNGNQEEISQETHLDDFFKREESKHDEEESEDQVKKVNHFYSLYLI